MLPSPFGENELGIKTGLCGSTSTCKVAEPEQVVRLDHAVSRFEREYGIAEGSTALLANIELARGLVQTGEIARASARTIGISR